MAGTVLLPWLIDIRQLENCFSECLLAPKSVAKVGFWPEAAVAETSRSLPLEGYCGAYVKYPHGILGASATCAEL
jgi:hypothetical protein